MCVRRVFNICESLTDGNIAITQKKERNGLPVNKLYRVIHADIIYSETAKHHFRHRFDMTLLIFWFRIFVDFEVGRVGDVCSVCLYLVLSLSMRSSDLQCNFTPGAKVGMARQEMYLRKYKRYFNEIALLSSDEVES